MQLFTFDLSNFFIALSWVSSLAQAQSALAPSHNSFYHAFIPAALWQNQILWPAKPISKFCLELALRYKMTYFFAANFETSSQKFCLSASYESRPCIKSSRAFRRSFDAKSLCSKTPQRSIKSNNSLIWPRYLKHLAFIADLFFARLNQ